MRYESLQPARRGSHGRLTRRLPGRPRRRTHPARAALKSPIAKEAIERIGVLYQIETHIRGCSAEDRLAARQKYAV
ncbi:MAG: transposase, partial [Steroidobacteraceae bacterium]